MTVKDLRNALRKMNQKPQGFAPAFAESTLATAMRHFEALRGLIR